MAIFKGRAKALAGRLKGKVKNFKEKHPKLAAIGGIVKGAGGVVAGLIPGAGSVRGAGRILKGSGKLRGLFGKAKGKLGGLLGKIKDGVRKDGKLNARKLRKTLEENGITGGEDLKAVALGIMDETGVEDFDTRSSEGGGDFEEIMEEVTEQEEESGEGNNEEKEGVMKKLKRWWNKQSNPVKIGIGIGAGVVGLLIVGLVTGAKKAGKFKLFGRLRK